MRKITEGNRKEFTIFTVVIIAIIGVLVLELSSVLTVGKEEYDIEENSIIFDEEYNIVELTESGVLQKKWNGSYFLKMGKEEVEIGKQAICYEAAKSKLTIYGNTYEVEENGGVIKTTDKLEITDLNQDRFIKLEDRKYLLIGESIKNTTETIETQKFLIVHLDKTGNTTLANYELNMKTIKPMVINTESYQFDVANEKLKIEETEIDLKKIIGSTNQYIEREKEEEENTVELASTDEEKTTTEQIGTNELAQGTSSDTYNSNNNSGSSQGGSSNNSNSSSGTSQTVNSGTSNSQIGSNIQASVSTAVSTSTSNSNGTSNTNSTSTTQNKTPLAKSINLRGITAKSSTLDIQYAILDPENKYQTIYIDVQGDIQKTIALDKTQRNYLITGLTPNTEYKVTLAYKEILTNNSVVDGIEDTMVVRTSKISDTLNVTKIAKGKVYFNYKMDNNYVYETGKIAIYVNGEKTEEAYIDIEKSITSEGWTSSFSYDYGSEIVLKLEGATYDGKEVARELQTKIKL